MGIGDATYHGSTPPNAGMYAANVLAHAALGCGMAAAQGGSCKSGALAAGFSAAAGPVIAGLSGDSFAGGLAGRMAAGCVGSYIGKGSCEAGAVTAAFDYLYNARGRDDPDIPDFAGDAWRGVQRTIGEGAMALATAYANLINPLSGAIDCLKDGCGAGGWALAASGGAGPGGKIVAKGLAPLKLLHSEATLSKVVLSDFNKMSTSDILKTFKTGEPLIVKADGLVMQGNHRVHVLQQRGFDVNSIPRVKFETYK